MKPSRELDALVEEKVFGHQIEWRRCVWNIEYGGLEEVQSLYENEELSWFGNTEEENTEMHPCYLASTCAGPGHVGYYAGDYWAVVPLYSDPNYIDAAWKVVEKIYAIKGDKILFSRHDENRYIAYHSTGCADPDFGKYCEYGESAPHAICLAALKAVEYERNV